MSVHFSSEDMTWSTPQYFFDELNSEFNFTLDPCCSEATAKCSKFYTEADDGLSKDWSNDVVFMNPPYGREIRYWVKKAYEESLKGATVACLIPARPDTTYWWDYIHEGKAAELRWVKGRLKFGDAENSAPFPSVVVVYRPPSVGVTNE